MTVVTTGLGATLAARPVLSRLLRAERAQVVKPDPLKGILLKDPERRGELALVHNWSVPGGVLYIIPRITRFQTAQDFHTHYARYYDCGRPTVGEVWVSKPAEVKRVSGGWVLREKGVLEVKDAAREKVSSGVKKTPAPPAPTKAEPKSRPGDAPPKTVKVEPKAEAQAATKAEPKAQADIEPKVEAKIKTAPPPRPASSFEAPREEEKAVGRVTTPTASAGAPLDGDGRRKTGPVTGPARKSRNPLMVAAVVLTALTLLGVIIAVIPRGGKKTANPNTSPTPASSPNGGKDTRYSADNPPAGMVHVPGGTFLMGGNSDPFERPPHEVTVAAFFIDQHEVTCEEYAAFVRASNHRPPPSWSGGSFPQGWARLPVTGVDWNDAKAYADWAGKRLPTEAEWEFAARGTDGRRYPWGNDWRARAANVRNAKLAEVMTHEEGVSPFGVHDMSGNAWEWTATDFAVYPGGDPSLMKNQEAGKVIRGGCYESQPREATATYRGNWPPRGKTYDQTGFRCAMSVPPGTTRQQGR
jgi:formylglycine-generating enzyme required for sulfatase activity